MLVAGEQQIGVAVRIWEENCLLEQVERHIAAAVPRMVLDAPPCGGHRWPCYPSMNTAGDRWHRDDREEVEGMESSKRTGERGLEPRPADRWGSLDSYRWGDSCWPAAHKSQAGRSRFLERSNPRSGMP